MIKKCTVLLILIGLFGYGVANDHQNVREIHVCNFNDGSDLDDVLKARDFFVKQLKTLNINSFDTFIWTPYRGSYAIDFLWLNDYRDLLHNAAVDDVYYNSQEGIAAEGRFAKIAACQKSGFAYRKNLFPNNQTSSSGADKAVIESFACHIKPGWNDADIEDLDRHLQSTFSSVEVYKHFLGFSTTPFVGQFDYDIYYYGVHDSLETFAKRDEFSRTSPQGQSLTRHWRKVLDCDRSLWWGQNVNRGE